MYNRTRKIYPRRLYKEFSWKFPDGYPDEKASDEVRGVQSLKRCDNNNSPGVNKANIFMYCLRIKFLEYSPFHQFSSNEVFQNIVIENSA